MGIQYSRYLFYCGYLVIKTDKTFYEPGDIVNGAIYIRCTHKEPVKHLILEIKG